MEKIKQKIYEFMYGRNGMDELNRTLFIAVLVIDLIAMITKNGLLHLVFMVGSIIFFYRSFSRNLIKRQEENAAYNRMIRVNKMRFEFRKEYYVFVCKNCKKIIRVPKDKGKIEITCPVCGMKKIKRT